MKIDLTCPVELWHYALPTRRYPVCRLQLFNLTERRVVSVQAAFACYDAEGSLVSRQVERVQGLSGEGRSAFEIAVEVEDGADAAGMDFSVEKVWFEGGEVWRHVSGNASAYTPNALPLGRRLNVLRQLCGADAAGFPSDQGAVWLCVCGRPNGADEDVCRRCGRAKRDVFTRFNEATVEAVIFRQDSAREEEARRAREQEKRRAEAQAARDKRRRRRRRRVALAVSGTLFFAVLAFGVVFHALPAYRFYDARRLMENGGYASAKAAFDALAARAGRASLPIRIPAVGLDVDLLDLTLYARSAEMSKECVYRQALETMSTGTIPALRTAQGALDGLGDYRDSRTQALEARYQRAQLLFASGQYESAIALYDETAGYRDTADRRKAALYQWACRQMEALEYGAAREKFLSLGEYEDAVRRAALCLYQPAQEALNREDYEGALALLSQLDVAFESTAQLLQRAYYGLAGVYFAGEQYETAAEYYLLAGDYLDSYTQATACLYEPACRLMEAGEYAQAMERFQMIPAYRDAQQKANECAVALAEIAMDAGDYEQAQTLLAACVGYEPAEALWKESVYQPAVALQAEGDEDGALSLLLQITGYADADARINAIRYNQALTMLDNGSYEEAAEAFAALGDYRESAQQVKTARYCLALSRIDQGQYEQAIAELTALADFEDSGEQILRAHYQLGAQLMAQDRLEEAAAHFAAAGEYSDARAQYEACRYNLAGQALLLSDYGQAAQYLADIPEYGDARELWRQSVYAQAEETQEAGDLSGAAQLFQSLGDYLDAAMRASACYEAYYAEAYATAETALADGDYSTAIAALESVSRENAGEEYADIEEMYLEANYRYAEELYDAQRPYDALRYYRNIPDYKDVAKKLDRVCYRMLGRWVSVTGIVMEFRDDGTCTIDGTDYYFRATTYAFYVGETPDKLDGAWTIHSCRGDRLSISNNRTRSQYSLQRDDGESAS